MELLVPWHGTDSSVGWNYRLHAMEVTLTGHLSVADWQVIHVKGRM